MKDAQHKWRFLTNLDCSSIKTEGQLCSMVKTRSGISEDQAKVDVDAWMKGKQFWLTDILPKKGAHASRARRPQEDLDGQCISSEEQAGLRAQDPH